MIIDIILMEKNKAAVFESRNVKVRIGVTLVKALEQCLFDHSLSRQTLH
jgi:hypothetical protein